MAVACHTVGQAYTLFASAARTDLTDGNGDAVEVRAHDRIIVLLDVTASATEAGDTLDVYVDASIDGTTWYNVGRFVQQAGDGSAKKEVMILDPSNPGVDVFDVTSDCASGKVRPAGFGRYLRGRCVVTEVTTDNASHTFSLVAWGQ